MVIAVGLRRIMATQGEDVLEDMMPETRRR